LARDRGKFVVKLGARDLGVHPLLVALYHANAVLGVGGGPQMHGMAVEPKMSGKSLIARSQMPPIRANDLPQYKAKAFALAPTLVDPPNWSFVRRHRISRLSGDGEKVKEARGNVGRRIAVSR
jgi:hypothetical protein